MSISTPLSWLGPSHPRMVSMADYRRCYVLFDEVESNIPRWGTEGEFGAWDYARGVLVEVSRRVRGTPVALHYRELDTPVARNPIGVEVTAIVRAGDGELVTVVSRHESAPFGARGDQWQLTVNGVIPAAGIAASPPSLPWMANLVWLHLKHGHSRASG